MDVKSTENLTVRVGRRGIILNSALLDQQRAWDNLETIKGLHKAKLQLYQELYEMDEDNLDSERCKEIAGEITELEFQLQDAWKFPRDSNFHKFWETPRCICPTMDNNDAWPVGYYVIVATCPIHGA